MVVVIHELSPVPEKLNWLAGSYFSCSLHMPSILFPKQSNTGIKTYLINKLLKFLGSAIGVILVVFFVFLFYTDLYLYLRPIPKDFDKMIQQHMEAAKLPGVSVLVFKDGKPVYSKQYGYTNLETQEQPTQNSLFQVASISKLVTGTAILKLYEQGKLHLDDDINKHLPFSVKNPSFPDTAITFRMLLSHVSSVSDGSFFFGSPYWDMYNEIGKPTYKAEPLDSFITHYFKSDEKYYDEKDNFNDAKLGTMLEYSNVGYGLLGYLVEQVSGMPFNEFCKQEIFSPLDMKHTRWLIKNVEKETMAIPYNYNLLSNTYVRLGAYELSTYSESGLKTSSAEFMRFLHVFWIMVKR
ncbi:MULTISPECIES: serine hydrolase domain-containing protein [Pseudoalteromonas]|nr:MULTISPECIES: serine hydrolase domain-containing protein [Pseudoalteromonas]